MADRAPRLVLWPMCCVFALGGPRAAEAAEWVPLFNATALMGQVMFDNKTSAWQGNTSLAFTPAVRFSDRLGLIPTFTAAYRGTKNVTELAGGGTLFQDEQAYTAGLKGIYVMGNLRLKPQAAYRWDFLRETKDEGMGSGLFDFQKPSAGLEAEWVFDEDKRVSGAFDWYRIRFPNYRTLESKAAAGLGREQSGGRALDTQSLSWTLNGTAPLPIPGVHGSLTLNHTDRYYNEQHIVGGTGTLSPDLRSDASRSVTGRTWIAHRFNPSIGGAVSFQFSQLRYDSNQNHYDAELNVFDEDYYSYDERSFSPRLSLVLGQRQGEVSVSYVLSQRRYPNRPGQDAGGTRLSEAVDIEQESFVFGLTVPLGGGFKLLAESALTEASSNMLYEKTFRYNYRISNHLFGVSYSF